jgi:hypothetical protein
VPELLLLVAAFIAVSATLAVTGRGADWSEILRNQALNIASGALLAAFAYVLFVLRFRTAQLRTYLERYRRPAVSDPESSTGLDALATTLVDELLDARPPRACLVVGPRDTARSYLVTRLAHLLAAKGRVPVLVDLASAPPSAAIAGLARDRFVVELVGVSGDERNGQRVFTSLVRRERVVALVMGVEQVGLGKPLDVRRHSVGALLENLLAEGIPFVACMEPELAPSISQVAAFRVRVLAPVQLVAYVMGRLEHRGSPPDPPTEAALVEAFKVPEPTRDPVLLDLAVDLLIRRVRFGEAGPAAVDALFSDPSAVRRHLAWMAEWTLCRELDQVGSADSPAILALETIGAEAHYRERSELSWHDATAGLTGPERRRFAAGVALLHDRGAVTLAAPGDNTILRCAHPAWLAFSGALAMRLDPNSWRDLLRSDAPPATLDALTAALLMFGSQRRTERSFLRLLQVVGVSNTVRVSLDMAAAAIMALQADNAPLDVGDPERLVLDQGWRDASEAVQLQFVSRIAFERHPRLLDFLWTQVIPPRSRTNTFRVSRAIAIRLGRLGTAAWNRLEGHWSRLLAEARSDDLSSRSRKEPDWRRHGSALASLGWVLPGVLMTMEQSAERERAFELLDQLRALVIAGHDGGATSPVPDVGLEISLAEGFKIAAVEALLRREAADERWWREAQQVLDVSRSWISRQVLLQALALVAREASLRDDLQRLAETFVRDRGDHPFVRETAALVRRAIDNEQQGGSPAERDIWFEDTEALEDGGINLSAEAHRLLGLSTLLINLAEAPFVKWATGTPGATEEAVDARDRAFTGTRLPRCYVEASRAATMFEVDCDCEFRFCGPDAKGGVLGERRRFSRAFLQRAEATVRASPLTRATRRSVDKAFQATWRALDAEVAKEAR